MCQARDTGGEELQWLSRGRTHEDTCNHPSPIGFLEDSDASSQPIETARRVYPLRRTRYAVSSKKSGPGVARDARPLPGHVTGFKDAVT